MNKFVNKNFMVRLLTSLILIPVVFYVVWAGEIPFLLATYAIAVLMAYEWAAIVGIKNKKWLLAGLFYIMLPAVSLLLVRYSFNGLYWMIYLLLTVWATDIGAYIFGIMLGGPKLAPSISPSKTLTGAIFGVLMAVCVTIVMVHLNYLTGYDMIFIAVALSVLAQAGDLLESYIKRIFDIKDSSTLIPGHGGVLDRMDSIVTTAPIMLLLIVFGVIG